MPHSAPKLHNAMWPGLVGKGTDEGQEPPISLEKMLQLTAAANVNGQKFDGIDYFLFPASYESGSQRRGTRFRSPIRLRATDSASVRSWLRFGRGPSVIPRWVIESPRKISQRREDGVSHRRDF